MSLHAALCLWGLDVPQGQATVFAAAAGFQSVDVRPGYAQAPLTERVLPVTCMAVAHLMPPDAALDAPDPPRRQRAVDHVLAGIAEAQTLGVRDVYVGPPAAPDESSRADYRESVLTLADAAARAGVRLGIEHFPGRGLPTVQATLDFIAQAGHANLYLLLDVGHNLIAGETVRASIQAAGDRLLYVHVNDNDGRQDLHLGLLEGVQTEAWLRDALRAVIASPYDGPVSVEVNVTAPNPRASMRRSLAILRRLEAEG